MELQHRINLAKLAESYKEMTLEDIPEDLKEHL